MTSRKKLLLPPSRPPTSPFARATAAAASGLGGRLGCALRLHRRGGGSSGSRRNAKNRREEEEEEEKDEEVDETSYRRDVDVDVVVVSAVDPDRRGDDVTTMADSSSSFVRPDDTAPAGSHSPPPHIAATTTMQSISSPAAPAAASGLRRLPPLSFPRRSRSLIAPTDAHYYLTSENIVSNAPFVPLSRHYDANDALLGLFASAYDDGDRGLAYAVGTRFVEVALYRIPKHGYYRSRSLGRRRTGSAADAMWVTGLLGGMMTTPSSVSSSTTITRAEGREEDDDDDDYDDRIATLRKLAIEARRSFEEALSDEGAGVGGGGNDEDDDGRRRTMGRVGEEANHRGTDDDDDRRRREEKDVIGTWWREYILGGGRRGGRDRLCEPNPFDDDAMMCPSLPDNICSFWTNVVGTSYAATTDDNDDDRDVKVEEGQTMTGDGGEGGTWSKRAKIDGGEDSPPSLPPRLSVDVPRVFDDGRREGGGGSDGNVDMMEGSSGAGMTPDDVGSHVERSPSPSYDEAANDNMAMEVDDRSIAKPGTFDLTAATAVEDDAMGTESAGVVRGGEVRQHRHHHSVDSRGFDKDALRLALSLSMRDDDDEANVVSSSSSRSSGEVTDASMSGNAGGRDLISVESLASLYREQYLALRDNRKIHVRFLDTFQGRNPQTTNGCTVIAPLTCVNYFTSSERNVVESSPSVEYAWRDGIPDGLINHVIDEHAASILPDVRKKLRIERDAFIIPSDVHDHLIEVGLLSTSQFVGVCGGNILDDNHLHAFKSALLLSNDARERERLKGRKIAATFFFHGHVVALHVVNGNGRDYEGNAWIELIDSLPDPKTWVIGDEWERGPEYEDDDVDDDELPQNAVRVRCTDDEHFDTLIRHYACSKFSEEERQFIDGTAWEDNNGYCEYSFDPRVFQAFIWAESD